MSNPQIESLKSQNNLVAVQEDIIEILKRYATKETPLCSHEILGLANINTIKAIANGVTKEVGGYSVPSSWIGSVASDLEHQNRVVLKEKSCLYSKHTDDAWYIEIKDL